MRADEHVVFLCEPDGLVHDREVSGCCSLKVYPEADGDRWTYEA